MLDFCLSIYFLIIIPLLLLRGRTCLPAGRDVQGTDEGALQKSLFTLTPNPSPATQARWTRKNMLQILNIAEIIVAILLTISILLQNKGAGLSSTFGGDMNGYYTKRGFEKFLLNFSIVLSVAFLALAIANLVVRSQMA